MCVLGTAACFSFQRDRTMTEGNLLVVVTTLGTLLTAVGGQILGYIRERRQRAWLLEDRAAASQERAAATAEIIARAQAEAEALRIKTEMVHRTAERTAAKLDAKLDTVHQVAVAAKEDAKVAYTEANNLNAKNLQLRQELLAITGTHTAAKLDVLHETATEIKDTATEIKDTVDRIDKDLHS